MTLSLKRAFQAAAKLPEEEQELLAAWIMEELAADRRWDMAFDASQDLLAALANEALEEDLRGNTQPL